MKLYQSQRLTIDSDDYFDVWCNVDCICITIAKEGEDSNSDSLTIELTPEQSKELKGKLSREIEKIKIKVVK